MGEKTDAVAKVRILVLQGGEPCYLLSKKCKKGHADHKKLEMLGGHLDDGEAPPEALVRELKEEESTGALAKLAKKRNPSFGTMTVDGAEHHLFELTIFWDEFSRLEADEKESLGFELVPVEALDARELDGKLTYRTRKILDAFGKAPEISA